MTHHPRYHVLTHVDHYHVTECSGPTVFDDRPLNPWRYAERAMAEAVATLLNSGIEPYVVREMDTEQVAAAIARIDVR